MASRSASELDALRRRLYALTKIGNDIGQAETLTSLTKTKLSYIASALERRHVPTGDAHDLDARDILKLQMAGAAISAVTNMSRFLSQNGDLLNRIASLWPDIWEWVKYVFAYRSEEAIPEGLMEAIITVAAALVTALSRLDQTRCLLLSTEGLSFEATRLYLHCDDTGTSVHADQFYYRRECLASLLDPDLGLDTPESAVKGVIRALSRIPEVVPRIIIRRVRSCIHPGVNGSVALRRELWLLARASYEDFGMIEDLLDEGALRLVLRCLASLCLQPVEAEADAVEACIDECHCFLLNVSRLSPNGRHWIIVALKAGVLPFLRPRLFREFFGHFIHYRSVIVNLSRHKEALSTGEAEIKACCKLLALLEGREKDVMRFDSSRPRCSGCDAVSVATEKKWTCMKKCSGCERALYCSSACQRAHWPEHKRRCQCMPSLSSLELPFPSRDYHFLVFTAYRHIEENVDSVNKKLAGDFNGMARWEVVFDVNFIGARATLSVYPLQEANGYSSDEIKASRTRRILIVMRIECVRDGWRLPDVVDAPELLTI